MKKFFVVFSTTPSEKIGRQIAHLLIQKRLAACVNVVPRLTSYFWWKGKIDKASESLLIIKTSRKCFKRLSSFLKNIHPYKVPEIVGFSIEKGFNPYLRWIENSLDV